MYSIYSKMVPGDDPVAQSKYYDIAILIAHTFLTDRFPLETERHQSLMKYHKAKDLKHLDVWVIDGEGSQRRVCSPPK